MASTTTDRLAGVTAGLSSKAPVRAATTANITLLGEQTIDDIAVVADDRVLVKNQTDGTENGIYDAASGAWVRALDFDGERDVVAGTFVVISEGTAGAGTLWYISTTGDISIGTTSIAFSLMTVESASAYMQTLLAAADSAAALATLVAAGTAIANTFSAINTFNSQVRWKKGADIASAATLVLGTDGNMFDVTGSTGPITAITVAAGTLFMLQFDSTPSLTHHATNLNLNNGGSNITIRAGDRLIGFATGSNQATVFIIRADGKPLTSFYAFAAQADMEASTAGLIVPPDMVKYSVHACKMWVNFDGTAAGPITPTVDENVTDVTDNGSGDYTVNYTTDFSTADYSFTFGAINNTNGTLVYAKTPPLAGSITIICINTASTVQDAAQVCVHCFGDQ